MEEIIGELCNLSAEITLFYDDVTENLTVNEKDYLKFNVMVSRLIYTKYLIEKTFGYGRFKE